MEIIHKSRKESRVRLDGDESLDTLIFAAALLRSGAVSAFQAPRLTNSIFDALEEYQPTKRGLENRHVSMKYFAIKPFKIIDTQPGCRAIFLRKGQSLSFSKLVFILQYQRVFTRKDLAEGAVMFLFEGLELLIQDQQVNGGSGITVAG